MKLQGGEIIPGVSISNVYLNMDLKDLEKIIGKDYTTHGIGHGFERILRIENAKFWIGEDGKVYQITASGDYTGTFRGVGIGSKLPDVEKFTTWKEIDGTFVVYELPEFPGICLELGEDEDEDNDEYDPRKLPIEYITVDFCSGR